MGIEDYPSWSPNGRTIAFAATQEGLLGNWDVYVLQVDSGQTANRTADDLGDVRSPAWSRDGRFSAYIDTDMLGNSGAQLWVLQVADGVTFPITGEETSPWSPS